MRLLVQGIVSLHQKIALKELDQKPYLLSFMTVLHGGKDKCQQNIHIMQKDSELKVKKIQCKRVYLFIIKTKKNVANNRYHSSKKFKIVEFRQL